jgi:(S)-2-hydroxyglutarate dehydrogenase
MSVQPHYDLAIIGGGIVGLATAREALRRRPDLRLIILEKEPEIAAHQSGHNSGVLHAGIYYKPGSLKAQACAQGRREMVAYCDEHAIPYNLCGKLIVALDDSELPALDELHRRGTANGVPDLERIGSERLREIEPHCVGIAALWSPHTGVIDFQRVAQSYAAEISAAGGEIATGQRVTGIQTPRTKVALSVTAYDGYTAKISASHVIACAGLHADRIARKEGARPDVRIVPFRGDYYTFTPDARHMVNGLIYPVPDPSFPWLGVHFTRIMSGEVWAGPNAVLAFAREGYRRSDVNVRDLLDALRFPGFWRLAAKHWRRGVQEMLRDVVKAEYLKTLQRYIPDLRTEHLTFGPSGVRAQALDSSGALVDDFVISCSGRVAHVLNAPSPAATSSLVVSRMIMDQVGEWFAG